MLAILPEFDRRSTLRHPVDYPVLGERPRRGDVALTIINISTRGFMAGLEAGLEGGVEGALGPGERLTLCLPVVGRIEAHVLWTDGRRAGLQFERILRLGDFTRMFVEMRPRRRFRERQESSF